MEGVRGRRLGTRGKRARDHRGADEEAEAEETTKIRRKRLRSGQREQEQAAGEAAEDRLSNLTDDILLCVLARLSIKQAARTSLLSRRWRGLLPTVDLLDLFPSALSSADRDLDVPGWILAVWRAIKSHRLPVQRCKISKPGGAGPPGVDYFDRWVRAFARRGVRELEMADAPDAPRDKAWEMAAVLRKCRSLRKLDVRNCSFHIPGHNPFKLYSSCQMPLQLQQPPPPVRCTALRELRLERTAVCEHLLQAVVAACGRLRKLELVQCWGLRTCLIEPAPWLRSLMLGASGWTRSIVVDAPRLRSLRLQLRPLTERLELQAPRLRELRLHLLFGWRPEIYRRMAPKLGAFLQGAGARLARLTLHGMAANCLSMNTEEGFLPQFRLLRKLYVTITLAYDRQALFLATLLQSCERLQQLNIRLQAKGLSPIGTNPLEGIHGEKLGQSGCLKQKLERVTMSGFTAEEYQLELAGFFLREAKVLASITLVLGSKCSEAEVAAARGLSSVKKASSEAKLIVKKAGRR